MAEETECNERRPSGTQLVSKKVDKKTWEKAAAMYQAWNKARELEKIREARNKTTQEKWREFLDLIEFGYQIRPEPHLSESRAKYEALPRSQEQFIRYENWRRKHGKAFPKSS